VILSSLKFGGERLWLGCEVKSSAGTATTAANRRSPGRVHDTLSFHSRRRRRCLSHRLPTLVLLQVVSKGRNSAFSIVCYPLSIAQHVQLSDMATRDQTDPVVVAINQATHERLQLLLLEMYRKQPTAAKFISDKLLIDANKAGHASNLRNEERVNTVSHNHTGKSKNASVPAQKRSRYAICEQCDQEFDVSTNKDGDCQWHDGTLY
jgi:hypothetical protein